MKKNRIEKRRFYSRFKVAAVTYCEALFVIDQLKPGTQLEMERDSNNLHDANAIAIYYDDHKVGYIPRDINEDLASFLDMGWSEMFDIRVSAINLEAHPEQRIEATIFINRKDSGVK